MSDQAALRRTYPFDHARAIDGMIGNAFGSFSVGGVAVGLAGEPLLRRGVSGLEQPIRVQSSVAVSWAVVGFADGSQVDAVAEAVGDGDVRYFVPAVKEPVVVRVRFPELGEGEVEFGLRPVRPWNVSLVHHSHFDIGYTDVQGRVITEQLAYLDDALRLAEADSSDGAHAFRWSVESIWVLREWIARRRPETVERFMAQVRVGRIEIAALPFNVHTETCSTEELHGLMRYASEISARYGLALPVAYQTDVPGCVAGTVDTLADAGVKYLAVAHNWAGRSVPYLLEGELPRLFRWASPAGNSVLVWMTTTAEGMAYQEGANLGFADSLEHVESLLPLFLANEEVLPFPYDENVFGFAVANQALDREPYPWNEIHVRVMGRVGDNCPPNRRLSEIVEAWNQRWEYPKLRVTRTQDFFEQVEEAHRDEIPTFTGDWNDWWADGIGSAARHLQMNRGAQAALSQAGSVDAMLGSDSVPGFADRIDAAWESVELFDEHTWGAAYPWTSGDSAQASGTDQWHWKAEKAIRAEQDSWLLTQEVLRAFAERSGGAGDGSVWVINTGGQPRSGIVSAFLPESLVHSTASIRLNDAVTGHQLAFTERNQANPVHRDAGRFLDIRVESVPAFGSRRIDIIVDDPHDRPASVLGTVERALPLAEPVWALDNGVLRVAVDPRTGTITSIREMATGTELVKQDSAFGFNAYVHDRLATRGEFNHLSGFVADSGPDLVLLADRGTVTHAAFEDAGEDALGSWVRFRSFGVGVDSVTTTLRLAVGADHLEITNRVAKQYTSEKESGFFAFPFAVAEPTVRFEVSGSVAGNDLVAVPGGASYMHTVRDWVALHGGGRAATLVTQDAALVQIGDIALPFAPFPGTLRAPEPGTVFSWIHNNIWDTNFPAGQAFDTEFRYRVRGFAAVDAETAGIDSAELAADMVRPLLGVAADPAGQPATTQSILEVADRRVRLLGVIGTERGSLLVKLQSLAELQTTTQVITTRPISGAWNTSLVGVRRSLLQNDTDTTLTLTLPPLGVTAIELQLA